MAWSEYGSWARAGRFLNQPEDVVCSHAGGGDADDVDDGGLFVGGVQVGAWSKFSPANGFSFDFGHLLLVHGFQCLQLAPKVGFDVGRARGLRWGEGWLWLVDAHGWASLTWDDGHCVFDIGAQQHAGTLEVDFDLSQIGAVHAPRAVAIGAVALVGLEVEDSVGASC